jgi:hypothetical protein
MRVDITLSVFSTKNCCNIIADLFYFFFFIITPLPIAHHYIGVMNGAIAIATGAIGFIVYDVIEHDLRKLNQLTN